MPILILQDLTQIILVVGSQAKSAKFSIAFIVDIFQFFAIFDVMVWVKLLEQRWE